MVTTILWKQILKKKVKTKQNNKKTQTDRQKDRQTDHGIIRVVIHFMNPDFKRY